MVAEKKKKKYLSNPGTVVEGSAGSRYRCAIGMLVSANTSQLSNHLSLGNSWPAQRHTCAHAQQQLQGRFELIMNASHFWNLHLSMLIASRQNGAHVTQTETDQAKQQTNRKTLFTAARTYDFQVCSSRESWKSAKHGREASARIGPEPPGLHQTGIRWQTPPCDRWHQRASWAINSTKQEKLICWSRAFCTVWFLGTVQPFKMKW